jgi:hypothetical protein
VHFDIEPGEVEAVGQVFFVDLAEVFVAAGGDELGERRLAGVGGGWMYNGKEQRQGWWV